MKIGIISDSHGRRLALNKALSKLGKVDCIFHLGDLYTDAIYIEQHFKLNTIYVKGNCDFSNDAELYREVEIGGKRFFLTHGHMFKVKWGMQQLIQATCNRNFNAVLFGHTHESHIFFENDTMFLNPGSIADPRGGKRATAGMIEITNNRMIPFLINVDG